MKLAKGGVKVAKSAQKAAKVTGEVEKAAKVAKAPPVATVTKTTQKVAQGTEVAEGVKNATQAAQQLRNVKSTYLNKPENVNRVKQIIFDANKLTEGKGELSPLGNTPDSAISSALYCSTAAEQGASIFRFIIHGHMFKNGNKRTAVAFWREFMSAHNAHCVLSEEQLLKVAGKVAKGELSTITSIAGALSQ